jgi:predicted short-subunit dehydrogenase-like oxidoreductase (DUF2520 family)
MMIGIIGAGAVGKSLGMYLNGMDQSVSGYYSKTMAHTINAAEKINAKAYDSLNDLILDNDLMIIAVNDDAIEVVVRDMLNASESFSHKHILHTSGVHTSEVLAPLRSKGAKILSVHPLQSFADPDEAQKSIPSTYFSIEGDLDETMMNWLTDHKIKYFEIDKENKVKYHLAAVAVSNYLVATLDFGTKQFESLGYTKDFALKALWPLVEGTINNVRQFGTVKSMTGPIVRGDLKTIDNHLSVLSGLERELYSKLGEYTVEIALEKGLDKEIAKGISTRLKEENHG